jgi:seryl-tRNA(Sec) selenium transferase
MGNSINENKQFVINTERVDALVAKKRAEIEKIEVFMASKIDTIVSQKENIERFLKPFGTNFEVYNLYTLNEVYNIETTISATAKFTLTKEYKNLPLLCSKLEAAFNSNVVDITGRFAPYKIKGSVVEFDLYWK